MEERLAQLERRTRRLTLACTALVMSLFGVLLGGMHKGMTPGYTTFREQPAIEAGDWMYVFYNNGDILRVNKKAEEFRGKVTWDRSEN